MEACYKTFLSALKCDADRIRSAKLSSETSELIAPRQASLSDVWLGGQFLLHKQCLEISQTISYSVREPTRKKLIAVVGNIPFDQTEESLKEIFSQVGPVVSFR